MPNLVPLTIIVKQRISFDEGFCDRQEVSYQSNRTYVTYATYIDLSCFLLDAQELCYQCLENVLETFG